MISGLFIFDGKGDVLMSKIYKEGIKRNVSDVFRIQVINSNNKLGNSKEVRSPILTLGSTSFVYIKSGKLWIVAVTRSNQDCSTILEFIYKFENILKMMVAEINDENIINNFFQIYQILDEIVQFGYPINLEPGYIKSILPNATIGETKLIRRKSNGLSYVLNHNNKSNEILNKALSTITWRPQGIKYRRNEIFLNVEEKINVLTNEQSEILRSYVDGKIMMKTHLSGMPECKFGLNNDDLVLNGLPGKENDGNSDSVVLEDCKFHQCVELDKFTEQRVIQFIPPDGEFQLMSYNCRLSINLPFKVTAQVQQFGSRKVQYKLLIKSLFPSKTSSTNVQIKIPTPNGVLKHYASTTHGKTKFHPEDNVLVWKFNKMFGDNEYVLTAEVELTELEGNRLINWSRPPIKLDFVIDMFSCSGLSVNYLRIDKANYKTVKWVKYSTQSGSYDIRY